MLRVSAKWQISLSSVLMGLDYIIISYHSAAFSQVMVGAGIHYDIRNLLCQYLHIFITTISLVSIYAQA